MLRAPRYVNVCTDLLGEKENAGILSAAQKMPKKGNWRVQRVCDILPKQVSSGVDYIEFHLPRVRVVHPKMYYRPVNREPSRREENKLIS